MWRISFPGRPIFIQLVPDHLECASGGEEIVNDENSLALGHGVPLDGERRAPVLEVEAGLGAVAGKLALLANLSTSRWMILVEKCQIVMQNGAS